MFARKEEMRTKMPVDAAAIKPTRITWIVCQARSHRIPPLLLLPTLVSEFSARMQWNKNEDGKRRIMYIDIIYKKRMRIFSTNKFKERPSFYFYYDILFYYYYYYFFMCKRENLILRFYSDFCL